MVPLIEEAITSLFRSAAPFPGSRMVIADLGCASGPNALALVSTAMDAICHHCTEHEHQPLREVCVFLNDLPSNDFNTVAKSLSAFKQSREALSPVVITTGMIPGSFHTRLFPSDSLHLVCSSTSLHWLSEVPADLIKSGIPMYDSDDNLRRERNGVILDAYGRQFRKDFTQFLITRAQELVSQGRMVISFFGRRSDDPASHVYAWQFIGFVLSVMASRGVISKTKVDSFYVPVYAPFEKELIMIIEDESSFKINRFEVHEPMGLDETSFTPKKTASRIRAVFEPIILEHFGASAEIMEEFERILEQILSGGLQGAPPFLPIVFLSVVLMRT